GAGKSIILGALGLLLGERANTSSIGNPEKKCVVEGEFDVKNYKLQELFQQENLDYEELTIIRRELSPSGKSRAFINDTPVNLAVLRKLTSKLIDIHSQHQNLEIENEKFQFQLVDSLAQNSQELAAYQDALKVLKELKKEREELRIAQQQQNADIDYWKFQLEELQTAQLKSGEQEELEEENAVFSQIENIQYTLSQADSFLNGDHSPISSLQTIANDFAKLKEVHSSFKELSERLESAYIELSDLAKEINIETERLENNPERAAYVSERLDTLYRLEQKHGKSSIEELLLLQQELEEKVFNIENFEQLLTALDKKIASQNTVTENYAKQLSESRKKIIPKIEKEV
ncbi:MAG: DNA repair protein RecN, partial [Bacteroidia bacterium]